MFCLLEEKKVMASDTSITIYIVTDAEDPFECRVNLSKQTVNVDSLILFDRGSLWITDSTLISVNTGKVILTSMVTVQDVDVTIRTIEQLYDTPLLIYVVSDAPVPLSWMVQARKSKVSDKLKHIKNCFNVDENMWETFCRSVVGVLNRRYKMKKHRNMINKKGSFPQRGSGWNIFAKEQEIHKGDKALRPIGELWKKLSHLEREQYGAKEREKFIPMTTHGLAGRRGRVEYSQSNTSSSVYVSLNRMMRHLGAKLLTTDELLVSADDSETDDPIESVLMRVFGSRGIHLTKKDTQRIVASTIRASDFESFTEGILLVGKYDETIVVIMPISKFNNRHEKRRSEREYTIFEIDCYNTHPCSYFLRLSQINISSIKGDCSVYFLKTNYDRNFEEELQRELRYEKSGEDSPWTHNIDGFEDQAPPFAEIGDRRKERIRRTHVKSGSNLQPWHLRFLSDHARDQIYKEAGKRNTTEEHDTEP